MQLSENGAVALATDEGPYAREFMSGRAVSRRLLASTSRPASAQDSHQVAVRRDAEPERPLRAYQQDGQWWSLDLTSGARTNLTGKIKSGFVNTEDDHPVPERRAYGLAGFTTGEKSVIVYDRFDLWQVNLDGSNPDASHARHGRLDGLSLRQRRRRRSAVAAAEVDVAAAVRARRRARSTAKARTIDTSKPLMLTATGDYNKKSGYASLTIGQPAQRLVWLDKSVTGLQKAENADVFLLEQQTVRGVAELLRRRRVAGRREAGVAHERVPERLRVGQAGADELQQQARRQAADDADVSGELRAGQEVSDGRLLL